MLSIGRVVENTLHTKDLLEAPFNAHMFQNCGSGIGHCNPSFTFPSMSRTAAGTGTVITQEPMSFEKASLLLQTFGHKAVFDVTLKILADIKRPVATGEIAPF